MAVDVPVIMPLLHPAQWLIKNDNHRFRVAVCGRRFGKTYLASCEAIESAVSGGFVWWVAPITEVTDAGWTEIVNIVSQMPGISIRLKDRAIDFPGGGRIEFKTASSDTGLRGRGLDFLVLDEAAFIPKDRWMYDLRATLSDRQGRALFISTPTGRNWFWEIYNMGQDDASPEWISWRFPTAENPHIMSTEIDAARGLLPERPFAQEYLAEFLEDGGAVFRNVQACISGERQSAPTPGHRYVFGVDWGRLDDFTVVVVLDRDSGQVADVERFNRIDWEFQRDRLRRMAQTWQPEIILAETNPSLGGREGDPNIEALQKAGLPVEPFLTTGGSKGPLINALAIAFETQKVGLFQHEVLISEVLAYTMGRTTSGHYTYSAPAGLHDDCVIALALAWRAGQEYISDMVIGTQVYA